MKKFDPIAYKKRSNLTEIETILPAGLIVSSLMPEEIIKLFSEQTLNRTLTF